MFLECLVEKRVFSRDPSQTAIRGGVCGGVGSDEEVLVSICDNSIDKEDMETVSSFIVEGSDEERGNGKAIICATNEGGRDTATYEVGSSRSSCI